MRGAGLMSTQKELSRAERRDQLFGALRAFARSWDEHRATLSGGGCCFCDAADARQDEDGRGHMHTATCPWYRVDKEILVILEQEYEKKEQQRHGASGALLRSCERLTALAERQLVRLDQVCGPGASRNLGQLEVDGELPPAISEARAVILKATV